MSSKTKEKQKEILLAQKVNVLNENEKNWENGQQLLAEQSGVGKTEIQQTNKCKA